MKKFEEFIGEGKITLKRRYTENHPAQTAGTHAKIRNKVLEAIADGTLTQEEFDAILKEMSNDSGRWLRRNSKYFSVSEAGVSLSKFGQRVLTTINISEADLEEGNAFGDAVRKAKENGDKEFEFDGETYPVKEGRGFVAAAKKAKDEGKKEFEFNGKTFPVLIKEEAEAEEEAIEEAVNASGYIKAGKLGYNDQFLGRRSLSWTLSVDIGLKATDEFVGPWLGFDHVSLYAIGKKGGTILDDALTGKYTYDELKAAAADFLGIKESEESDHIHESFSSFLESLNEAFGSMKLSKLFTSTRGKVDKALAGAFYGKTKVALDKVQDEDLIDTDPMTAYKAKQTNTIVFYISDNEKENPHAPYDGYKSNQTIPGGGYLLAVASGGNEFYTNTWTSRYSSKNRDRTLKTTPNNSSDTIGISKKYKGWDGTGLYNVKRIAEVADRAVVINIDLLQQKYSTANKRDERSAAKAGAIAFKSDKDFKQENKNRYTQILATKAAALPLDKMVSDAIDELAKQIQDGLKAGEKTEYGEIYIGKNKRGSTVKLKDASSHMSSILDDYSRYCDYIARSEESEKKYGSGERWYEREAKTYAKSIKDRINKIKTFDYAW
jgi:hypothetical protein